MGLLGKPRLAEDIGFFNLLTNREGPVLNSSRYIFYKDIYIFTNRLKNLVKVYSSETILPLVTQTFRGSALI